jgi:hypothetical protein
MALSGLTPYVTPYVLQNAPTGISWKSIPSRDATPPQQQAEMQNICIRATSMIDTICNNVLRATVDTEQMYGPDFRMTVNRYTQVTRIELSRYPITQVLGGQYSNAAQFPPQWIPLAADLFMVERPSVGIYGTSSPAWAADGGQSILVAPGYLTWLNGRQGFVIQVTYVNGWPHASMTAAADIGDQDIQVDDVCGWAPSEPGGTGATGIVYDGANQETIQVLASSASQGPGVLTLSAPLQAAHDGDIMVSALPAQIIQAAILFATSEALVRGATATTINTIAGGSDPTVGAGHYELSAMAHELCMPFRRVI